jgi:hypothetical protein
MSCLADVMPCCESTTVFQKDHTRMGLLHKEPEASPRGRRPGGCGTDVYEKRAEGTNINRPKREDTIVSEGCGHFGRTLS